jgi:hypothetical protein
LRRAVPPRSRRPGRVGVGDDQLHPGQPPGDQPAQKRQQPAPSSAEATSRPRISRCPSALTPVAPIRRRRTAQPPTRRRSADAGARHGHSARHRIARLCRRWLGAVEFVGAGEAATAAGASSVVHRQHDGDIQTATTLNGW